MSMVANCQPLPLAPIFRSYWSVVIFRLFIPSFFSPGVPSPRSSPPSVPYPLSYTSFPLHHISPISPPQTHAPSPRLCLASKISRVPPTHPSPTA
ncbi:hypothetical protein BOTBODRAFT_209582 [Botryobasidium botryosum FD-172 SS1]|uniref:Uncharacterized protein n=1 Tax=Botryobasidium botryosum (strain FD-172 SS1) TaxID=930990 RepID=A0A067N0W5_BOTB1|nr:hypothetical protein BOTBODRAFT_209582 [Botryobasidium botryosum FD-172 SS1]